jgi:hypothetical protein
MLQKPDIRSLRVEAGPTHTFVALHILPHIPAFIDHVALSASKCSFYEQRNRARRRTHAPLTDHQFCLRITISLPHFFRDYQA